EVLGGRGGGGEKQGEQAGEETAGHGASWSVGRFLAGPILTAPRGSANGTVVAVPCREPRRAWKNPPAPGGGRGGGDTCRCLPDEGGVQVGVAVAVVVVALQPGDCRAAAAPPVLRLLLLDVLELRGLQPAAEGPHPDQVLRRAALPPAGDLVLRLQGE